MEPPRLRCSSAAGPEGRPETAAGSLALLELLVDAVEQLGRRAEAGEAADLVVQLLGASVEGEELQRGRNLHRVVVEDRVQYAAEPVELGVDTVARQLVAEAEEP